MFAWNLRSISITVFYVLKVGAGSPEVFVAHTHCYLPADSRCFYETVTGSTIPPPSFGSSSFLTSKPSGNSSLKREPISYEGHYSIKVGKVRTRMLWVGRIMAPQKCPHPNLQTCLYITLKRTFADIIELNSWDKNYPVLSGWSQYNHKRGREEGLNHTRWCDNGRRGHVQREIWRCCAVGF